MSVCVCVCVCGRLHAVGRSELECGHPHSQTGSLVSNVSHILQGPGSGTGLSGSEREADPAVLTPTTIKMRSYSRKLCTLYPLWKNETGACVCVPVCVRATQLGLPLRLDHLNHKSLIPRPLSDTQTEHCPPRCWTWNQHETTCFHRHRRILNFYIETRHRREGGLQGGPGPIQGPIHKTSISVKGWGGGGSGGGGRNFNFKMVGSLVLSGTSGIIWKTQQTDHEPKFIPSTHRACARNLPSMAEGEIPDSLSPVPECAL